MSESPLSRMKRYGSINVYELTAADELLAAFHMTIGTPVSRDTDLGIPATERRSDSADNTAAHRLDMVAKYRQWELDVAKHSRPARVAVRAILFGETPMRQVERVEGWRNGTARTHFIAGLRHFAALRGNTPRGARGWKITEARVQ